MLGVAERANIGWCDWRVITIFPTVSVSSKSVAILALLDVCVVAQLREPVYVPADCKAE